MKDKKIIKKGSILITNDDGINSQGLNILEGIANLIFEDVWVVAPEKNCSGSGHSISIDGPIRIRNITDRRFAISGTPVDCVIMAIKEIMFPKKPMLLLSGINEGANLGDDIHYSGTAAAAREGCLFGIPSIAISQVKNNNEPINWFNINNYFPCLLKSLIKFPLSNNSFLNINFPIIKKKGIKGIKITNQSQRKPGNKIEKRFDLKGETYYWISTERTQKINNKDTDLNAILNAFISISVISTHFTPESIRINFLKNLSNFKSELNIE